MMKKIIKFLFLLVCLFSTTVGFSQSTINTEINTYSDVMEGTSINKVVQWDKLTADKNETMKWLTDTVTARLKNNYSRLLHTSNNFDTFLEYSVKAKDLWFAGANLIIDETLMIKPTLIDLTTKSKKQLETQVTNIHMELPIKDLSEVSCSFIIGDDLVFKTKGKSILIKSTGETNQYFDEYSFKISLTGDRTASRIMKVFGHLKKFYN